MRFKIFKKLSYFTPLPIVPITKIVPLSLIILLCIHRVWMLANFFPWYLSWPGRNFTQPLVLITRAKNNPWSELGKKNKSCVKLKLIQHLIFTRHYGSGTQLLFMEFYKISQITMFWSIILINFSSNSIICDDLKQNNLHTLSNYWIIFPTENSTWCTGAIVYNQLSYIWSLGG